MGFQVADAGRITVKHEAKDSRAARGITVKAEKILTHLETEFGIPSPNRITVILASSTTAFQKAQPAGAHVPAWASGVAYPKLDTIILKTRRAIPNLDVDRLLAHELSHLALGRLFGDHPAPTWLNEGLTMHLADDWGVNRQVAMVRAIYTNRLIPLNNLVKGFPGNRVDAETAYAQSYYFIAFLKNRHGPEVMGRLIKNLALGVRPRHALHQASGLKFKQLEKAFFDWLNNRFSIFWILTGPGAIWSVAAVLMVLALIRRRRLSAKKIAEWEAEDGGSEIDIGRP